MSDESQNDAPEKAADAKESLVDLSSLKDLSFGPAWTTSKPTQPTMRSDRGRFEGRPYRADHKTDRRPARPPRRDFDQGAPRRDFDQRSPRRDGPDAGAPRGFAPRGPQGERRAPTGRPPYGRGQFAQPVFNPTVDVLFYPEDSAFRALTKAIRNACRTYELFEVAQLILEKPERFVAVIKPVAVRGQEPSAKLYQSVPDGLVFESEDAAVTHVCKDHLDRFFTAEAVEVEAPKGSFAGVSKCTLSGELIAPPNYHRYQELLRAHHAERYPQMSYERFVAQVELDKDPESVNAWLEKMTKTTRYTEKTAEAGAEAVYFDSLAAARAHLLAHSKDKVVKETAEARISGRQIELLPAGNLRRSIEFVLEQQRRFPLATANNLRGRLRRMKFGLYKRGTKGISYVCAVKRRFRDENTVFAKNLQELIVFIEKHPNIYAKDLPEKFLGIVPVVAEEPEQQAAPAPQVAETSEQSLAQVAPVDEAAPAVDAASAPVAAADPNAPRIAALLKDLHWLVSEGYVTEYGDGRLFTPAPMPAAKVKQAEAEAESESAQADEDAEEAPAPHDVPPEDEPQAPETPAEAAPVAEVVVEDVAPAPAEQPEKPAITLPEESAQQ